MPRKVTAPGWYDITGKDVPRELFPSGRLKVTLGNTSDADREKRRAELKKLRTWGGWAVFRAISDGRLHVAEVTRRIREKGEAAIPELVRETEAAAAGAMPTVREEADRYLVWYTAHRRARSAKQVTSRLKRFCEQAREDGTLMGSVRIDRLLKADVERGLLLVSKAASTQEALRLAVSGLYSWSLEEERERGRGERRATRWGENPAAKVERQERGKRVATVPEAWMLRLIAAAEVYQEVYLRVFAQLGLRLNELLHTRLHNDLDLRDWVWRIQPRDPDPRCTCPDCTSEKGWAPKSKRSRRVLLVPEGPIREALLRYLEADPAQPGDFVFRNPRTGRAWEEGTFTNDFQRLCVRADVPYGTKPGQISIHAFRHTCATEMLRAGQRESVIAALLGDSVQTITDTYIHIRKEDLAEAVRRGPQYLLSVAEPGTDPHRFSHRPEDQSSFVERAVPQSRRTSCFSPELNEDDANGDIPRAAVISDIDRSPPDNLHTVETYTTHTDIHTAATHYREASLPA